MKQIEKSIIFIFILILVIVITSSTTYIIMSHNLANPNNDQTPPDDNQTLSVDELNNYLSYVPNAYQYNAYQKANSYLSNVDNIYLLSMALGQISNKCGQVDFNAIEADNCLTKKINKSNITNILHEMYNTSFPSIKSYFADGGDIVAVYNSYCYSYDGENFTLQACNTSNYHNLSKIKDYQILNNNLIIYEYAAYLITEEENIIKDYQTDLSLSNLDFNTNYEKFTLYKHTFKKNDTGYYWYSTEVAEN